MFVKFSSKCVYPDGIWAIFVFFLLADEPCEGFEDDLMFSEDESTEATTGKLTTQSQLKIKDANGLLNLDRLIIYFDV